MDNRSYRDIDSILAQVEETIEKTVCEAQCDISNQFREIFHENASLDAVTIMSSVLGKSVLDLIYDQSGCFLSIIIESYCDDLVERLKPQIIAFLEKEPAVYLESNLWNEYCRFIQDEDGCTRSIDEEAKNIKSALYSSIEKYLKKNNINATDAYAIHWKYGNNGYEPSHFEEENQRLFMCSPSLDEICLDIYDILESYADSYDFENEDEC